MNSEKTQISSSQLMYLIIGMIQGSILTLAFVNKITKQNTWIIVVTGFITTIPLVLIYVSLSRKFPEKNIIQINEEIYGVWFGKFISIIYIGYYFFIVPYNLRFMGDFLTNFVFPETPLIVFIIVFTLLCSWAVRCGIEVIARCSPIVVFITFIITILTILLLLNKFHLSNFLPVFELNLKEFIQGTHIMLSIPFGEIIVFLMINSNINDVEQLKGTTILSMSISALNLLLIVIISTAVLGILSLSQVSPAYQVLMSINIGGILTRLESLSIMVLLFTIFIKVSVFYYATALSLAELLKLRSYKTLVTPLGIIMISVSILIYDNALEEVVIASTIYPVFVIPIQIFIPIITLILAKNQKQLG